MDFIPLDPSPPKISYPPASYSNFAGGKGKRKKKLILVSAIKKIKQ